MYIATNEMHTGGRGITNVMPAPLRRYMCSVNLDEASELLFIAGKPLIIRYPDGDYYLTSKSVLMRKDKDCAAAVIVTERNIEELLERITKSSLYSVKDQIRNGYITIEGGHRAGIAGTAVTENGSVEFIRNVSAVNIRLAEEIKGAGEAAAEYILSDTGVKSTFIISPPGAGKTTMLRDITRILSESGFAVSVADERCEIAAMHDGRSAFDLGAMTTVMDNCPKSQAMLMLLRAMSPEVIVTDEIGTAQDGEAVRSIMNSGVAVITSAHGKNREQLMKRREIGKLCDQFDVIITLSKRSGAGTIEEIYIND